MVVRWMLQCTMVVRWMLQCTMVVLGNNGLKANDKTGRIRKMTFFMLFSEFW